jgi:hypothetical protein
MKKASIILFCIGCFFSVQAQIESGKVGKEAEKVKQVKTKKVKEKKEIGELAENSFFMAFDLGQSYRNLQPTTGLFGKPLGSKVDETPMLNFGAQIGIRSKLSQNFFFTGGIGLTQYGEQYTLSLPDSSSTYKTSYRHLSLPLGLQYVTGKKVRFSASFGLQPQLFMAYRQESSIRNSENVESKEAIKQNTSIQPFTLATFAELGLEIPLDNKVSLVVSPLFRYQLTSTFQRQTPHRHNAYSAGLKIGMVIGF